MGRTRLRGPSFAECFVFDNATPTVITTQDEVHGINIFGPGHSRNISSKEGISGTTSAFADYGATVAGTVKATDADHGLDDGDIITINGGANYVGIHTITVIDDDNFYFTAVWVADDGAQPWDRPDYILPIEKADYDVFLNMSANPGTNNSAFLTQIYVNETPITHFVSEHTFKLTTEVETISITGVDPLLRSDKVWVGIKNLSNAGNITIKHGNFTLQKKSE